MQDPSGPGWIDRDGCVGRFVRPTRLHRGAAAARGGCPSSAAPHTEATYAAGVAAGREATGPRAVRRGPARTSGPVLLLPPRAGPRDALARVLDWSRTAAACRAAPTAAAAVGRRNVARPSSAPKKNRCRALAPSDSPRAARSGPRGRHEAAGEAGAARRGLEAARELFDAALAALQRRVPRRHPDYVAALVNAALTSAALGRPAGADAVAACRRGVRAVRAAGGAESGVWRELEQVVETGLAGPGGPGGGLVAPVAVWPVRCGVGVADVAASARAAGRGA